MIKTWNINPQLKGTTLNQKKLKFPFDITNCVISMQFKGVGLSKTSFEWSTVNGSFEKINATEVIMKSRLLDYNIGTYNATLKVVFSSGEIKRPIKVTMMIL
jgi:hypothetical protein